MATKRFMIDIETLACSTDAAILSIGLVEMFPSMDEILSKDNVNLCVEYIISQDGTRRIDFDTLAWWLADTDRAAYLTGILNDDIIYTSLEDSLHCIRILISNARVGYDIEVWANSPVFDLATLRHAYKQYNIECPWGFREERDYRTIRSISGEPTLFPVQEKLLKGLTAHSAADDALYQSVMLTEWLRNK